MYLSSLYDDSYNYTKYIKDIENKENGITTPEFLFIYIVNVGLLHLYVFKTIDHWKPNNKSSRHNAVKIA